MSWAALVGARTVSRIGARLGRSRSPPHHSLSLDPTWPACARRGGRGMRKPIRRSRGYLAGAATLAVVAILTARPGGSNHDPGPSTPVVVATEAIERGAIVEASQV